MRHYWMLLIAGMLSLVLVSSSLAAEHGTDQEQQPTSEQQYGEQSQTGMEADTEAQPTQAASQEGQEYGQNIKDLQGMKVVDANGENIGEIGSALVDTEKGEVTYITLKSGGVFGMGGEQYPIPWKAVQVAPDQQGLQINFTSDELKDAPKGGQITSRDQAEQVYQFYGVSPHWEEGQGQEQQMQPEEQTGQEQAPGTQDLQQRPYEEGEEQSY